MISIIFLSSYLSFIFFAGLPPYIENSSTSFVTIEPAAIIAPFLIVTPDKIIQPKPIHTSSSIMIGPFDVASYFCDFSYLTLYGYVEKQLTLWFPPKMKLTLSAIDTKLPIIRFSVL